MLPELTENAKSLFHKDCMQLNAWETCNVPTTHVHMKIVRISGIGGETCDFYCCF